MVSSRLFELAIGCVFSACLVAAMTGDDEAVKAKQASDRVGVNTRAEAQPGKTPSSFCP